MITRISSRDILASLLSLVAPAECIVCSRALTLHERHICIDCLADLPRTHFSTLARNPLSERFNAMIQRDLDEGIEFHSFATALFFYRSSTGYRKITQKLKYEADIRAGRYFSSMLGRELASSPLFSDVDLVVPVPLHPTRRWTRGYNQSEVIAEEVSRCLGAEMRTDILKRVRRTQTQTKVSVDKKVRNVKGAFALSEMSLPESSHILLVDDVFTTGATLHSCFTALRMRYSPSTRISVATLACVGK